MSDQFDDQPDNDVMIEEEDTTELTPEQSARVEALWQARAMLTSDSKGSVPFGTVDSTTPFPPGDLYAHHLMLVATFILDGGEDLGIGIPFAEIEPAETQHITFEAGAIVVDGDSEHARECACKIAASFRGGEADVPTEKPETSDDDLSLHYGFEGERPYTGKDL